MSTKSVVTYIDEFREDLVGMFPGDDEGRLMAERFCLQVEPGLQAFWKIVYQWVDVSHIPSPFWEQLERRYPALYQESVTLADRSKTQFNDFFQSFLIDTQYPIAEKLKEIHFLYDLVKKVRSLSEAGQIGSEKDFADIASAFMKWKGLPSCLDVCKDIVLFVLGCDIEDLAPEVVEKARTTFDNPFLFARSFHLRISSSTFCEMSAVKAIFLAHFLMKFAPIGLDVNKVFRDPTYLDRYILESPLGDYLDLFACAYAPLVALNDIEYEECGT